MKIVVIFWSLILLTFCTCVCGLSSHGNDFYIGALRNHQGRTDALYLYIMTQSSSSVDVTVEDYNGVIATGNITNTNLLKFNLSKTLVTFSNNYNNRHKGIRVYTDGGMISVLLVNYLAGSIGEYLAYPVQQLQNVAQYQYYAVSTFQRSIHLSEALLIGTDNNTTVTVTSPVALHLPHTIQLPSSANVTISPGISFSFTLHRMQTLLIGMPNVDITGTSITSNKPLTVVSGHECCNIPVNVKYCEHFTVQLPPTVEWGRQFLLSPYGRKPIQYYKIIASESLTYFVIKCGDDGNLTTLFLSGAGNYHTHSAAGHNIYCSIFSNKPISVYQLGAGYESGRIGDPVISYIPPIKQFSSSTTFVSPNIRNEFPLHYISIVATSRDIVLLDGTQLMYGWNAIYDYTNNVIGYGAQAKFHIADIPRTITTQSNTTMFYVLVYGYGSNAYAYSYVTGFNSSNITDNALDLCLVNNGNCEQKCVNEIGSFHCECDQPGYIQSRNASVCILATETSSVGRIPVFVIIMTAVIVIMIIIAVVLVTTIAIIYVIIKKKNRSTVAENMIQTFDAVTVECKIINKENFS